MTLLLAQTPVPVADLPFEHEPGRIWLKATLNGKPIDAMLDTGSETSVADAPTAVVLGAQKVKAFDSDGAGGDRAVKSWEVKGLTMALTGTSIRFPVENAIATPTAKTPAGHRQRLMIGRDFLMGYVAFLDYAKRRLKLYEPTTYVLPDDFKKLGLVWVGSLPIAGGQLELPGMKRLPISVAFDTGLPVGLVITNGMVAKEGLARRYAAQPTVSVREAALGGDLSLKMVSGVKGSLGDEFDFNGFAFLSLTPGGALGKDADANVVVGDEFLRHCDVIFSRSAVYLRPNGQ